MEDVETTEDEQEIVTEGQHDNAQEETDDFDWKADALKHRAISTRLKVKLAKVPQNIIQPKVEQKIDNEVLQDVKFLKEIELKRQFGFENNLSPQETDYAFKFANGKPSKETLEDAFFKGGIESLRSKNRLEHNIPGSSSRSSVFTEKAFTELSEDERKNTFESKMKGIKK